MTPKPLDKLEYTICKFVSAAFRKRCEYLEMMAAAYARETKIPIRHCVLVEKQTATGIEFSFADKRIINPQRSKSL